MKPTTTPSRRTTVPTDPATTGPGDTQRVLTHLADSAADVAIVLAWAVKMLAWFVATGFTASGWAALGVPEPGLWPPPPRLAPWHRTHRRLLSEIDNALSLPDPPAATRLPQRHDASPDRRMP